MLRHERGVITARAIRIFSLHDLVRIAMHLVSVVSGVRHTNVQSGRAIHDLALTPVSGGEQSGTDALSPLGRHTALNETRPVTIGAGNEVSGAPHALPASPALPNGNRDRAAR